MHTWQLRYKNFTFHIKRKNGQKTKWLKYKKAGNFFKLPAFHI